jgi:hypothetical protein
MLPLASLQISGFFALAVFIVGFFGLTVLVIALAFRGVTAVLRALFGGAGDVTLDAGATMMEHCPHARCGHANPHRARFCARCGRALRRAFEDRVA